MQGNLVRKTSLWGNVIVEIQGNQIRRFGTNELIATVSGNSIYSGFGGTLIAEIQGDEIRNPFNGQLLYIIDENASPQEIAGLAVTALILNGRL